MTTNYAGFAFASFAIAIAPGASWMYVITSTITHGRSGGWLAVSGNALGILVHVAAAVLGLSALLRYSPSTFIGLKLIGAAYLIYLAVSTLRGSSVVTDNPNNGRSSGSIFRGGILVNATNPKAALLMLALLPQFVQMSSIHVTRQILACGLIHLSVASCVLSTLVLLANQTRVSLQKSSRADRIFRWTSAIVLAGFGIHLATASM
jgi:threonine/homoserine/homoserine lactone efflux protein